MTVEQHDKPENSEERRDFLAQAAWWTTAGALTFATVGIMRMPKPGVLPGQSTAIKIGTPGDYPVSSEPVRVPGHNLFLVHDDEGFWAVSAICTHLGCIVAQTGDGYSCPCHGSHFSRDGKVTQGPAPSSLPWYELSLAPDGQLVVHTANTVPVGTKYPLG
ncbi:MAG: ubiquinol-cytochrome c reductase iron-sulfur subunit [Gemmataceae bacterium]